MINQITEARYWHKQRAICGRAMTVRPLLSISIPLLPPPQRQRFRRLCLSRQRRGDSVLVDVLLITARLLHVGIVTGAALWSKLACFGKFCWHSVHPKTQNTWFVGDATATEFAA